MTLNDRILDFLDGSLPADDEAELLHTLSVSPEKRGVLREFMQQRALLERDSKSLPVPYEAEQRLWARLDQVMPVTSPAGESLMPLPVETSSAGFLARAMHGATAFVSALTLLAGIGIGYFAGAHNSTVHKLVEIRSEAPLAPAVATNHSEAVVRHTAHRVRNITPEVDQLATNAQVGNSDIINPLNVQAPASIIPAESNASAQNSPGIAAVNVRPVPAIAMMDIGGDGAGIKPLFHRTEGLRTNEPTFLQRFEFRVDEDFGRQFPNNASTNVSLPLITNSSLSTFFQVLPHSNLLWVGAGYGTANITRKNLFTQQGDPLDPSQQVLAGDTVHEQTSYIDAIAELHLPAFATTDLTLGAGYGFASLGRMLFGEVGLHYNISEQVGANFGVRVLQFSYDLTAEKQLAIQSRTGGLAISNAVAGSAPSYNMELNTGLFFHF